jgi:hypothetical protein
MTLTAQAGFQLVEAAEILRRQHLQLLLNIEIGNITLGSAACCHTKDSLDGVEYGRVNSYVTNIKWVSPSGELQEASEEKHAKLLSLVRSSYGLCGIVHEVTLKIKPLEVVRFNYLLSDVNDLTREQISEIIANNESLVCWTVGRTVVVQTRNRTTSPKNAWLAGIRRRGWSHIGAYVGARNPPVHPWDDPHQSLGKPLVRHATSLLPVCELHRGVRPLQSRQDHQLRKNTTRGPGCVYVLGLPPKRTG